MHRRHRVAHRLPPARLMRGRSEPQGCPNTIYVGGGHVLLRVRAEARIESAPAMRGDGGAPRRRTLGEHTRFGRGGPVRATTRIRRSSEESGRRRKISKTLGRFSRFSWRLAAIECGRKHRSRNEKPPTSSAEVSRITTFSYSCLQCRCPSLAKQAVADESRVPTQRFNRRRGERDWFSVAIVPQSETGAPLLFHRFDIEFRVQGGVKMARSFRRRYVRGSAMVVPLPKSCVFVSF